jgi:lactoylglutathione lyase
MNGTCVTDTGGRNVAESLKGLGAITLFVEDLAASKTFYTDVFGLQIVNEDPESVAFDFGNTILNVLVITSAPELIEPASVGSRDAGARVQLTIWVSDADATIRDLTSRGVQLLNGPLDRPWGVRTATFSDPAGNIWEIAQQLQQTAS